MLEVQPFVHKYNAWHIPLILRHKNTTYKNNTFCMLLCDSLRANICQGSKGLRHRPINWCTSPIIYKNNPFFRLQLLVWTFDTQLKKTTNQNSIKVPKAVKSTNNYKTLGTSVINSPMSPSSLNICPPDYLTLPLCVLYNIICLYKHFQTNTFIESNVTK